ncbi:hypothetical protein L0F63_002784 [Massospora cicadina]|nr:hypothetical protein L0F63_002784 [Massospora cicadina]
MERPSYIDEFGKDDPRENFDGCEFEEEFEEFYGENLSLVTETSKSAHDSDSRFRLWEKAELDPLGLDFGECIVDEAVVKRRSNDKGGSQSFRQEFTNFEAADEDWDDETWEEVEGPPQSLERLRASPKEVIIISKTEDLPSNKRRKFTGLTREQRVKLIALHRVTLLAWVGVLLRLNRLCDSRLVQAIVLSHMPPRLSCQFPFRHRPGSSKSLEESCDKAILGLSEWWNKAFRVSTSTCPLCDAAKSSVGVYDRFLWHAENLTGCCNMKWALLTALGRCVGIKTRLVMQVRSPISRKATNNDSGLIRLWSEYKNPATGEWLVFPGDSSHLRVCDNQIRLCLDYVVGISAEGVEDVTANYVSDFLSRHHQLRQRFVGASGCEAWLCGWWGSVLRLLGGRKLHQTTLNHHVKEKMPTTLAGFKSHPLLVLERHVPKTMVVRPQTPHVGLFKGEKVFPRSALVPLKSKKAWWLLGREIHPKYQHLESTMVLFPEYHTRVYAAPLLGGNKIPRNKHGSFDLFQPNMLPKDAAHLTEPDAALIARRLGLDYARAVVGFQHGASGALPVEDGVIVSKADALVLRDAIAAYHASAQEREAASRRARAIRHWKAYIRFLEIKLRLGEDYGDEP